MSSILRKLRKLTAKRALRAKSKTDTQVELPIPLPPGIEQKHYLDAMAFLREKFPELRGRDLHNEAIACCVAYEHEKKVQRVLMGAN